MPIKEKWRVCQIFKQKLVYKNCKEVSYEKANDLYPACFSQPFSLCPAKALALWSEVGNQHKGRDNERYRKGRWKGGKFRV